MLQRRLLVLLSLAALALAGCSTSAAADKRSRAVAPDPLATLSADHPRLLVLDDDLQRIRRNIEDDPTVRTWYAQVYRTGVRLLDEPAATYAPADPLRNARRVLLRVSTLAGLYRLSGERRFAERCRDELRAAAAFPDWDSPGGFLGVAEMTAAVAIGYDWLYPILPNRERAALESAIDEKGWAPAERAFARRAFWTTAAHNWNPVSNGGIALGVLAVAERDRSRASKLLGRTMRSVPIALRAFGPDGGWEEGPGYANYAARYATFMIAGLSTACGDEFGLLDQRGFADAGRFRMHTTTPTGGVFNFGDGGDGPEPGPHLFWLATALDRPEYATFEQRLRNARGDAPGIFDVMWYDPPPNGKWEKDPPLDAVFRNPAVGVATFRSAWDDPDAAYLGFKGGSNQAHHGHLDLGTFVLDTLGERWAIDLGADDYSLPHYNDAGARGRRWRYYRTGVIGHNTLVVAGKNQDPEAAAPLVAFVSSPARAHAVVDLSMAYRGYAKRVRRGVALLDRRDVLVQDEVDPRSDRKRKRGGGPRWSWQMHTPAEVRIADDGATARLTRGGKALEARLLSPAGARFEVETPAVRPPQRPLDVRKLIVRVPDARRPFRIAVLLTPATGDAREPVLVPLGEWRPGK
jgi:hypothetical protein